MKKITVTLACMAFLLLSQGCFIEDILDNTIDSNTPETPTAESLINDQLSKPGQSTPLLDSEGNELKTTTISTTGGSVSDAIGIGTDPIILIGGLSVKPLDKKISAKLPFTVASNPKVEVEVKVTLSGKSLELEIDSDGINYNVYVIDDNDCETTNRRVLGLISDDEEEEQILLENSFCVPATE